MWRHYSFSSVVEMIAAEKVDGGLYWVICSELVGVYVESLRYNNDTNWDGIHLHPASKEQQYCLYVRKEWMRKRTYGLQVR